MLTGAKMGGSPNRNSTNSTNCPDHIPSIYLHAIAYTTYYINNIFKRASYKSDNDPLDPPQYNSHEERPGHVQNGCHYAEGKHPSRAAPHPTRQHQYEHHNVEYEQQQVYEEKHLYDWHAAPHRIPPLSLVQQNDYRQQYNVEQFHT